jgi:hypothetical protein
MLIHVLNRSTSTPLLRLRPWHVLNASPWSWIFLLAIWTRLLVPSGFMLGGDVSHPWRVGFCSAYAPDATHHVHHAGSKSATGHEATACPFGATPTAHAPLGLPLAILGASTPPTTARLRQAAVSIESCRSAHRPRGPPISFSLHSIA